MGFGNIFKKAVSMMLLEELEKESKTKEKANIEAKKASAKMKNMERMICNVEAMNLNGFYGGMPKDELERLRWKCTVLLSHLDKCDASEIPPWLFDRWCDAVGGLEFEISAMNYYLQDFKE